MAPQHTTEEQEKQALAALHALGALEPDEAAVFAAQAPGQSVESRAFARISQILGAGVTPVAPPARLRERLLARLQSPMTPSAETSSASPSTVTPPSAEPWIVRAQEGRWKDGPAPGLSIKTLFYDATRQYATQLLRIEPGAQVPPHLHADTEELYVLEGSCIFNGETFFVGDYARMVAGSIHSLVTSENGCLLWLQGSTQSTILT